tara:strand:+ start:2309 stop:2509 length:201 start_codon:yes stop_codon:yes gene_type:complete
MKQRWVNNIFVRFMRYCVLWSEHRHAIKILNKLSDRELKDIGLSRVDIDRMVWLKEDKDNSGRETK